MKILSYLFLFAAVISNVYAESNPPIRYVGIEQGLSNNNVTSIFEDRDGFVWFGTFDGLNRYDGEQFMIFKNQPEDFSSLSDNRITDIAQDSDGSIWVASKSGLAKLGADYRHFERVQWKDYSAYQTLQPTLSSSVNQLAYAGIRGIFAATSQHGLLNVNTNQDQPRATKVPLLSGRGKVIVDYNAQAVVTTADQEIWVFVLHHGLCRLDKRSNTLVIVNAFLKNSIALRMNPHTQSIWVAAADHKHTLFAFDLRKRSYQSYPIDPDFGTLEITALYTKDDRVYLASEGKGIITFDRQTKRFAQYEENRSWMKNMTVYSMYIDHMDRQWIGTLRSGVQVVDNRLARFHLVQPGADSDRENPKNFILSFAESKHHNLWIGTDGAGIMHWNRGTQSYRSYTSDRNAYPGELNNNFITGLLEDASGYVWATTYGGGINRLDPKTGLFKQYDCISPVNNRVHPVTWKIIEDKQQRIWVSTLQGGGIFCYNPATDQFDSKASDLVDVLSIYEEDTDVMWFGSWSTLSMRNFKTGEQKVIQTEFPVRDIFTDHDGYVWLASEGGGLLRYHKATRKIKRYSEKDGLPSNTILTIQEDNAGKLWLSTYNGLVRFDPKTEQPTNYYDSDGLQSNQFSYNASIKLSDGSLAFGGIHGFNHFQPEHITPSSSHAKVAITGLNINNKPISYFTGRQHFSSANHIDKLTIPFHDAVLNVYFSALEYSFPSKIKYAYYLDGWDKNWNEVDHLSAANYTNLKEGNYTLRIKSTNADGMWSDLEKTVEITILPPWWRSIWAYLVYIGLLGSLVFAYLRYDRRQTHLKYTIQLAHVNAEKKKELHEKQIAFFTHIAHEFRNPLTLIVNPLKEMSTATELNIAREDIYHVYRNSKRLLNLVDKLLLFRKTESGMERLRLVRADIVGLVREVFTCFQQQATLQQINYSLDGATRSHILLLDREKMEICLFNLISNAFKYTPKGGHIRVVLQNDPDHFSIQVIDTGCGISVQNKEQVFEVFERDYVGNSQHKGGFGIGLFLVRNFIEAHKGSVKHQPNYPSGTQFEILLKNGTAHLAEFTIFEDVVEHSAGIDEFINVDSGQRPSDRLQEEVDVEADGVYQPGKKIQDHSQYNSVATDQKVMVVVDDNVEIRKYLRKIFQNKFELHEADSAESGFMLIEQIVPDIILSDVVMGGLSGIDLCQQIKSMPALSHIPIILLTASNSQDIKLKGLEGKADDYITKPFDRDMLVARVQNLIQNRSAMQQYFYNEITLQQNDHKISKEHREFLEKSMAIVAQNLDQETFTVKELADQVGMSHSNFYKRIKAISGKSANEFIRFVRLRKVAQLLIETDANVSEAAFAAGFNDIKYFRTQFLKVFGMRPSEFKKKYDALRKNQRLTI